MKATVVFTVGVMLAACAVDSREIRSLDDGRYELTKHFEGLNEDVTLVKTPARVYAIRADGSEMPYLQLLELEKLAYRQRFGSVDIFLAQLLASIGAGDASIASTGGVPGPPSIPVALEFALDWTNLTPGLQSTDLVVLSAARQELVNSVAARGRAVLSQIEPLGFVLDRASDKMPMLFGHATPRTLERLRKLDGILIHRDEGGKVINDAAPNTVTHPHIDTAFSQGLPPGKYASGQRIGILEPYLFPIADAHEAFNFNGMPVTYLYAPTTVACSSPAQCNGETCGFTGRCETIHASEVASVISASRDGAPWSSAMASLFLHSATPVSGSCGGESCPCTYTGNDAAYNAFFNNGVSVVNRSNHCTGLNSYGQVEDYYAYYFGLHTATSAPNQGGQACPQSLNATCVGYANQIFTIGNFTTTNPPGDREEPDLVLLGQNADVLGFASATDKASDTGTSFATPIAASMLALLNERCIAHGIWFPPRYGRACLREAGFDRNISGWKYETPAKVGALGQDGAGYAFADDATWCCDPSPPGSSTGHTDIIVDLRGGTMGPPGDPNNPPSMDGPPTQSFHTKIQPQNGAVPGSNDGRKYLLVASFSLVPGSRLRTDISWDACAVLPNVPPSVAKPDFDLFIWTTAYGIPRYYYSSQSFDDNQEGFDVDIFQPGQYDVYIAWMNGATGCNGSPTEPLTAAWTVE